MAKITNKDGMFDLLTGGRLTSIKKHCCYCDEILFKWDEYAIYFKHDMYHAKCFDEMLGKLANLSMKCMKMNKDADRI